MMYNHFRYIFFCEISTDLIQSKLVNDTLVGLIDDARLHESLFWNYTIERCPSVPPSVYRHWEMQPMEHARSILSWSSYSCATNSNRPSRPDPTWRPRNNLRIMRTLRGARSERDFPPAWYPVNRLIANDRTRTWSTAKRAEKLPRSDAEIISWSLS